MTRQTWQNSSSLCVHTHARTHTHAHTHTHAVCVHREGQRQTRAHTSTDVRTLRGKHVILVSDRHFWSVVLTYVCVCACVCVCVCSDANRDSDVPRAVPGLSLHSQPSSLTYATPTPTRCAETGQDRALHHRYCESNTHTHTQTQTHTHTHTQRER